MDLMVSEPMAELFMTQCMGEVAGHMAMIPNNPTLYGLCKAHRINDKDDFARFLRQVADQLTKEQKF
jgi:hypothetical protein